MRDTRSGVAGSRHRAQPLPDGFVFLSIRPDVQASSSQLSKPAPPSPLESSSIDQLAAERNLREHWGEGKDDCVFDVLTGDLMAVVGAY
jgi:hypothetical protein